MPRAAPVTTATGSCPLRVGWANSSLLTGDLKEELAKLKKRDGKNILIPGSPTLVRSLLRDRLLDELALNIMPAVVGSGMRLFEGIGGRVPLELVESKTFGTGAVGVTYRPARLRSWRSGGLRPRLHDRKAEWCSRPFWATSASFGPPENLPIRTKCVRLLRYPQGYAETMVEVSVSEQEGVRQNEFGSEVEEAFLGHWRSDAGP